ncbi:hypothetical protein AKJ52_01010, partial [candidate division MSBL1 archaeon SCGC-AAA382C18]
GVDGDNIGNIEIKGSLGIVSISDLVVDEVANNLGSVSGQPVLVFKADDNFESHFLEYARLVEIEREEEMKGHEEEIRNLSGREREERGRALLHLRGRDEGTGLGGKHLVKLMRHRKGEELPDTEITVGDLVMLSKNDPLRDDNPTGTLSEKTNYSITVAFDKKPPGFIYGRKIRCDLYVNDITYQRQLESLTNICKSKKSSRLRKIAKKALGLDDIEFVEQEENIEFLDEKLNSSQREAVRNALSTDDFFLIHGPPGTGKTITCVEVTRQILRRDKKVLCTADSNTAVDNLVEWLAEAGEKVIRIGHPARVTPMLRKHTLDEVVQQNEKYQKSQELRKKAMSLLDQQEDLTAPSGKWRRGMSNEKIKSFSESGKSFRGVPASKIQEMADWLDIQERVDDLFDKIERLEDEAVNEIIEWAGVVCATNSGCGSELMSERKFDTVIIDEATQATEPSCWIPITLANRVIMAGDHKQLPPTVLSQKAEELSETLFESLIDGYGNRIRSVLKTQYRMNLDIMNFSNSEFYDNVLIADESVAKHTLSDLVDDSDIFGEIQNETLNPEPTVVFLDTKDIDASERTREGSTSKENLKEAEIIESLTSSFLDIGIAPEDIAVITPYGDQSDLIRRKIGIESLEVDTVDGFQGREKEVVLISFIRSNRKGNVGFLDDVRRLNVAITRAKRKLVIVGDSDTVGTHETYSRLIRYISKNGLIITL